MKYVQNFLSVQPRIVKKPINWFAMQISELIRLFTETNFHTDHCEVNKGK